MRRVIRACLCFVTLAMGCQHAAPPPPSDPVIAAEARSDAESFKIEQADQQRYVHHDDVYFSQYTVAEDDEEPANAFFAATAAVGSKVWGGFKAVFGAPVDAFHWWFKSDRPNTAARKMEDASSADARREGINDLLEYPFTKRPPYTIRYRQIAQYDSDSTVRAVAIRASNRARDVGASPVFVVGLDDKSELVRLEAAKALVHLPEPAATAPLMRILANREENRDVRIAAADALKHYRNLTVARALAASLGDKDFGVIWQARRSLVYLIGHDYRYDEGSWLSYFAGPDKPFG